MLLALFAAAVVVNLITDNNHLVNIILIQISLDITTCTIFPIRSTMDIRALMSMVLLINTTTSYQWGINYSCILQDRDYRIIVINANPPLAHTVLCEVSEHTIPTLHMLLHV